jgi:hypothetical protein
VTAAGERRLLLAVAVVHAALVAWLISHHEPWRDEAESWITMRDGGLAGLFEVTGRAGTPSLWYLIQAPFVKLGLPFVTLSVVNAVFAIAAMVVMLFHAPFPLLLRVALPFGYLFSFEYAVVARHYALSMLLAFSCAALFQHRQRHPLLLGALVALLANTNTHSFFVASAFTAVLAVDHFLNRSAGRWFAGIALPVLGVGVSFVSLFPPADACSPSLVEIFGPGNLIRGLSLAFVPGVFHLAGTAFGALVVGVVILSLVDRPRALGIVLLSYAGLGYVFVFKFSGWVRQAGYLFVVLLIGLWIAQNETPVRWRKVPEAFQAALPRIRRVAFGLVMASAWIAIPLAIQMWHAEWKLNFSEGHLMARYILDRGLVDRRIAAHPPGWHAAVLVRLPKGKTLYYPGLDEQRTFQRWDTKYANAVTQTNVDAVTRVQRAFPDWRDAEHGMLLLLARDDFDDSERFGYRLLYATPGTLFEHFDEQFYLYEPIPQAQAGHAR